MQDLQHVPAIDDTDIPQLSSSDVRITVDCLTRTFPLEITHIPYQATVFMHVVVIEILKSELRLGCVLTSTNTDRVATFRTRLPAEQLVLNLSTCRPRYEERR